tara:strand:- start:275 stop:1468 length:1194 start_codon:yes stop_codon:yes gene_type:complete
MIRIGIAKEYKVPFDSRSPITPKQAKKLNELNDFSVSVEKSNIRCFSDQEFLDEKVKVQNDLSHCNLIIGIKEIPVEKLLEKKTYLIFSHTIKKQKHNKNLLKEIIKKKIKLIDYECLNNNNKRIIAFGKYAGIAGAYNTLMGYGLKYKLFQLKRLKEFKDTKDLYVQNQNLNLRYPIKILITGKGRVSKGCEELLRSFKIKKIKVNEFLKKKFKYPTYTIADASDYYKSKKSKPFNKKEFYDNPKKYKSTFKKFIDKTDILINGTYWNPNSPRLFEESEINKNFGIKIIGDISCDINGSIPCTKKASTIDEPFFDYCVRTKKVKKGFIDKQNITIMSIDNLASELPRDASNYFGNKLINEVLPLFKKDEEKILYNATIAENGRLKKKYKYLEDFII